MPSIKETKVDNLRNAIPSIPATGEDLKHLAKVVRETLAGTPIQSRTDEILANHVPNQAKTGRNFNKENAGYLNGVASYIESSLSDDLSDLDEGTFDMYLI